MRCRGREVSKGTRGSLEEGHSLHQHLQELEQVEAPWLLRLVGLPAKLLDELEAALDGVDGDEVGGDFDAVCQVADLMGAVGGDEDSLAGSLRRSSAS